MREMRRKAQQMTQEEVDAILNSATSGVLALTGDEGYPYAVPLSFVYHNGAIYFHCGKTGHKVDAIGNGAKASFCVIAQDHVLPGKFTTIYRSVIAFGEIHPVDVPEEKLRTIRLLADKYGSPSPEVRDGAIKDEWDTLLMLEMRLHSVTGKKSLELVDKK